MLNIVLVEPQIPQNTGNIARTCAATGAILHLVHPLGFAVDNAKLKRAGLDYWHLLDIRYHNSLESFFQHEQGEYYFFTTKGRQVFTDNVIAQNAYLIFGREDQGLPESLLVEHPDNCLRLPMKNGARSLNLSNTVAIAAYEALRQWGYPELEHKGSLTQYNWKG